MNNYLSKPSHAIHQSTENRAFVIAQVGYDETDHNVRASSNEKLAN